MVNTRIRLHDGDLPDLSEYANISSVAVDTETMGLNLQRDRLCTVQLYAGKSNVDIVRIRHGQLEAPNLKKLLQNKNICKIFHFARFDLTALYKTFSFCSEHIFCTKIASKLSRTYTKKHSLYDLCADILGINLCKQQQCSDWGAENFDKAQLEYAASDVLYLQQLKEALIIRLKREKRLLLAESCFQFLPVRVMLDMEGWLEEQDVFAH